MLTLLHLQPIPRNKQNRCVTILYFFSIIFIASPATSQDTISSSEQSSNILEVLAGELVIDYRLLGYEFLGLRNLKSTSQGIEIEGTK